MRRQGPVCPQPQLAELVQVAEELLHHPAENPQLVVQQESIGFPLARLAVLLSLATGACLDMAIAPYAGKGTGETSLLRLMYDSLRPGDVVVADALFDNYFIACELRQRGIELVVRVQAQRVRSQTLESGAVGDIITRPRPGLPRGMARERYKSYPEALTMRQLAVDARGEGNRAERFEVATSLLDPAIGSAEVGALYRRRWGGELDIRAIKSTMRMDILRCKTPAMVEKEIWAHLQVAQELLQEPTLRAIGFQNGLDCWAEFDPRGYASHWAIWAT